MFEKEKEEKEKITKQLEFNVKAVDLPKQIEPQKEKAVQIELKLPALKQNPILEISNYTY
jgi:hypothetical protein